MKLNLTLLKWIIPSNWVTWLKGRKRLLGVISLVLWVMIYAIPETLPQHSFLATSGKAIAAFLASLGLNLDTSLFGAGAGLTVVGVIDWIAAHVVSDSVVKVLRAIKL